jgi:hypothetical protein
VAHGPQSVFIVKQKLVILLISLPKRAPQERAGAETSLDLNLLLVE